MGALVLLAPACTAPWAAASSRPLIFTVAGTGAEGHGGSDGQPATEFSFERPSGVLALPGGGFLLADQENARIVKVDRAGRARRVAGTGRPGFSGDAGPARRAQLSQPADLALLPGGAFLIADAGNDRIRKVSRRGLITTVAGSGPGGGGGAGYAGDGGPATSARLNLPLGVAALQGGGFLIADDLNAAVRQVDPSGRITTAAGTGTEGYSGDGGPAHAAQLDGPFDVAPLPGGGFLIAEVRSNRIRKVDARGVISTVAGSGESGDATGQFFGDGGSARRAGLAYPAGVTFVSGDRYLIADAFNNRVRAVRDGRISTLAGSGQPGDHNGGYGGDGGPASRARLWVPAETSVTRDGGVLVADTVNSRIRLVVPRRTRYLAVALRSTSFRNPAVVRYTVTRPARLTLTVLKAGRRVAQHTERIRSRRGRLRIGRHLSPGRYELRLVARSGPRLASHHSKLIVSDRRNRTDS